MPLQSPSSSPPRVSSLKSRPDALWAKATQLGALIGHTPLLRLDSLSQPAVSVYAKLEWQQFSGSVKARAAHAMVLEAIRQGRFSRKAKTDPMPAILEATSGNTGIALAAIGAHLGIPVQLCLPANASAKRKQLLRAYGAQVLLTDPLDGTDGAQAMALSMAVEQPERFVYLDQYNNPQNRAAHERGTAKEIMERLVPTHFIAGLGTSGSFNGTSTGLKAAASDIRCISLQPDAALHGLEGWKHMETAVVPGIHDPDIADESWGISSQEAVEMMAQLAQREGLLLSPSSAANAVGAARLARQLTRQGMPGAEGAGAPSPDRPLCIVTLFPDDIARYDEHLPKP